MIFFVLIGIGFFLLIERKIIGLVQFRLGPNKVLFLGILQFFIDFIKLLVKERGGAGILKFGINLYLILVLFFRILFWLLINYSYFSYIRYYFFIILFLLILIKIVMVIFYLLGIKSLYVQVRLVRVVVQFVSYDILIILMIVVFMILILNFSLVDLIYLQKFVFLVYMNIYLFIV